MSSFVNLDRRVSKLEAVPEIDRLGPAILICGETGDEALALAEHEAKYGKQEGEPFFIRLVGVEAPARR